MKQRDAFFDNAKSFLIVLVVFAHLLRGDIESNTIFSALYSTIFSFHMPAFVLISGYFAKGDFNWRRLRKLAKKLLIPYFLFQILYTLFYSFIVKTDTFSLNFFYPRWSLWYLLSLFCWQGMLPLYLKMKKGTALFLSILSGVGIGYLDPVGKFLSLSRTFVFFPFFLVGYFIKEKQVLQSHSKGKSLLTVFLLAVLFISFTIQPWTDFRWFYGSLPYSHLDLDGFEGGIVRLLLYAIAFLLAINFFSLVPEKKSTFTRWGQHSIYVYLLHGFIVKSIRFLIHQKNLDLPIIAYALLAVAITAFLSSPGVIYATKGFVEGTIFEQFRKFFHLFPIRKHRFSH